MKDIQNKFQSELPEKQKLIEENQRLRKEIDDFAKKSVTMKEQIEKEIQEKEKKNIEFQTEYMTKAKKTLEKAQSERDNLVTNNLRLKKEIEQYTKTQPERDETFDKWNKEYNKFVAEITKVK